ncbi:MAG TPA: condensation domain-containing protein, partial [Pseudonocardia sp.]|nr:condensation domain-containing protein [Pseudonocardia sp.]
MNPLVIPRRVPGTPVPLTPAQSRLWVLDRSGFGGSAYLCWTSRRYRGPLDAAALARALHALAARHEALRTSVEVTATGPVQVVSDAPAEGVLEIVDLTNGATGGTADVEREAKRRTEEFVARPMRLDRPPLHRALLLRLAPDDHVLVWVLHHIVCDGQSLGVLESELFALYRGEDLGPAPAQFPDYAVWLAGHGSADSARGAEYWRGQLRGAPAVQSLPSDRARPAEPS